MGGFLLNGCGASDSYYQKKILGNHYCNFCFSIQEFDLMELKRKVRVFWIPLFSISTKYAVVCKKCKTGIYVDDSLRDDLFYGRKTVETQNGNIVFKDANDINPVRISGNLDERKGSLCPNCGAAVDSGQTFCTSCGHKL